MLRFTRMFLALALTCAACADAPSHAPRAAVKETPIAKTPVFHGEDPLFAWTRRTDTPWPLPAKLRPSVTSMPATEETSIAAVAHYIAAHEPDPLMRVKALHDWVADRIRYESNDDGEPWASVFQPTAFQKPAFSLTPHLQCAACEAAAPSSFQALPDMARLETTWAVHAFEDRKGVCANYASLLAALAGYAGVDVAVVIGKARIFSSHGIEQDEHAWNVATIDGHQYLLDPTWDAGSGEGAAFEREYSTEFLFAPPEMLASSHWPNDASLALEPPNARVDLQTFSARPLYFPRWYAANLTLVAPKKQNVETRRSLDVIIENPSRFVLRVDTFDSPDVGSGAHQCISLDAPPNRSIARCYWDHGGTHHVMISTRTLLHLAAFDVIDAQDS